MGERMGRMGRIRTDFFSKSMNFEQKNPKKIRSNPPNPPHPFSHFPYEKLLSYVFQKIYVSYAPMC